MFWPLVLPIQITLLVLVLIVVCLATFAPKFNWKRVNAFFVFSPLAFLLFVPSCVGVISVVDVIRFGDFHYQEYGKIPDFRSQRYMPKSAKNIEIRKHANGFLAKYETSETDFLNYLSGLYDEFGLTSEERRQQPLPANQEFFNRTFSGLNWQCPTNAITFESPTESDGGGATYFVDFKSGVVYQRTGFW